MKPILFLILTAVLAAPLGGCLLAAAGAGAGAGYVAADAHDHKGEPPPPHGDH